MLSAKLGGLPEAEKVKSGGENNINTKGGCNSEATELVHLVSAPQNRNRFHNLKRIGNHCQMTSAFFETLPSKSKLCLARSLFATVIPTNFSTRITLWWKRRFPSLRASCTVVVWREPQIWCEVLLSVVCSSGGLSSSLAVI